MQLYMTDKAIEFNSEYGKIERVLNALKEAHIDISRERKEALNIKSKIDYNVLNMINPVEIELLYDDGIKSLKELGESLKKYEVYFTVYNSAGDIEHKLQSEKIGEEQLKTFARVTIGLLKRINSSDTKAFQSEEEVVNKVYDVAYGIIKMELLTIGKSDVLDWVKNDAIAASLIDTRVFENIATVPKDSTMYAKIRSMLADINMKRNDSLDSGLNYTALDEGLILFLALQDGQNIEKIEASLFKTINDLLENEAEIEKQKIENIDHKTNVEILKDSIKKSYSYKKLALALGLLGLVIGIKKGGHVIADNIGHDEYKTNIDYYYSSIGAEAPEYPEYMYLMNNESYSTTFLYSHSPWTKEGNGIYSRETVTFDLSGIDIEDLTSIDTSQLNPLYTQVDTTQEIDPSMLYEEAITEIIKITQDPNDTIFVQDSASRTIFLIIISLIDAALSLWAGCILSDIVFALFDNAKENGPIKKTEMIALADGLKRYEELTAKNSEFRKRFIESYQKYSHIIKDADLKEKCESILQRIKSD